MAISYFLLFSMKNETLSGISPSLYASHMRAGIMVNPVSVISGNTKSSTPFSYASCMTSRQCSLAYSLSSYPISISVIPTFIISRLLCIHSVYRSNSILSILHNNVCFANVNLYSKFMVDIPLMCIYNVNHSPCV